LLLVLQIVNESGGAVAPAAALTVQSLTSRTIRSDWGYHSGYPQASERIQTGTTSVTG